jgi:hypothetical protein
MDYLLDGVVEEEHRLGWLTPRHQYTVAVWPIQIGSSLSTCLGEVQDNNDEQLRSMLKVKLLEAYRGIIDLCDETITKLEQK